LEWRKQALIKNKITLYLPYLTHTTQTHGAFTHTGRDTNFLTSSRNRKG